MALDVHIVSREKELWSGEATSVKAPSVSGYIGILQGRQPLLAGLAAGTVTVKDGNEELFSVEVEEGFLSADSDRVIVGLDYTGSFEDQQAFSKTVRTSE